jgi:magnesium chelatase family protein
MLERQNTSNAELSGQALRKHAKLLAGPEMFANTLIKQLALSGRGFDRLLRVARTIADLSNADTISEAHLAEAARYRDHN